MNIAFVTSEFVTEKNKGGQATYIANIATILSEKGHNIYILTASDCSEDIVWKDKVYVCRVEYTEEFAALKGVPLVYGILNWIWFTFGMAGVLRRRLMELSKEVKLDIVQYSNLRGITVLKPVIKNSIVRLSNHQGAWRMASKEFFDINDANLKLKLHERIWLYSLKNYKKIFAPSWVVAKLTSEYINRNVDIIESPVSINVDYEKPAFWDNLLEGKKYYLFFGTMNYIKGIHTVCKAAELFLDKYPDRYIVLLGPNSNKLPLDDNHVDSYGLMEHLVVRHKENIIFMESIYNKKWLNYILREAIACLMPSRIDNFPNTCVEAMANGAIVFGTNGASFEQLIVDGENGFLCERDDYKGLVEKMCNLESMSEEKIRQISEKARQITVRISPDEIYEKLFKYYTKILENA